MWLGIRDAFQYISVAVEAVSITKSASEKFHSLRIRCDTLWISHYDQQKAQQYLVAFVYLADLALSGFPYGPILSAPVREKTLVHSLHEIY
jgi:hypothetical protein